MDVDIGTDIEGFQEFVSSCRLLDTSAAAFGAADPLDVAVGGNDAAEEDGDGGAVAAVAPTATTAIGRDDVR